MQPRTDGVIVGRARVGPTTPTRHPRLDLSLWRLDWLSCCQALFAAERPSPSAREHVRYNIRIVTIALELNIFRVLGRRGSAKESAVDIVPL
jgi:hypothetical protein